MTTRPRPRPLRLAGAGLVLVLPAALLVAAAPAALAQEMLPEGCVESGEQVVCTYDVPGSFQFTVPPRVTEAAFAV
ncbi:MAG: hypothetical protein L0I24_18090, partial [Pseudonocardia sp.]|nr:hypothetical protein [Pseudonocardia sp.]